MIKKLLTNKKIRQNLTNETSQYYNPFKNKNFQTQLLTSSSLYLGTFHKNTNFRFNKYIFCSRNNIEIFDTTYLRINILKLQSAFQNIVRKSTSKKINLFFCSRTETYAQLLKNSAKSTNMSFSAG